MKINGEVVEVPTGWEQESLLSVLRDALGMTGTKFGCGKGLCGACTVHVNGAAVRACITPAGALGEAEVTTIEGLGTADALHPVQQAWVELNVPQCGYCQPGQIMTAAALLATNADPDADEVAQVMNANLCRCGTYPRIQAGVLCAARLQKEAS